MTKGNLNEFTYELLFQEKNVSECYLSLATGTLWWPDLLIINKQLHRWYICTDIIMWYILNFDKRHRIVTEQGEITQSSG